MLVKYFQSTKTPVERAGTVLKIKTHLLLNQFLGVEVEALPPITCTLTTVPPTQMICTLMANIGIIGVAVMVDKERYLMHLKIHQLDTN